MEKLEKEQQEVFDALQKPTMSLIASFYEMPEDVKSAFADMMAIYEANPTEAVAKTLYDKVMGGDSAEDKKSWLKKQAAALSPSAREAGQKYITNQTAVPRGLPPSGMVLVGLGVVSAAEKNTLMEAQAAARLICDMEDLSQYQPRTEYKKDGIFERAFLDKPSTTEMQRLEHIVNIMVNDLYTLCYAERQQKAQSYPEALLGPVSDMTRAEVGKNEFLQKARNEALRTLKNSAAQLQEKNPNASKKIGTLAETLTAGRDLRVRLSNKDYEDLKEQISGHHAADAVWHRVNQILDGRKARQAELSKQR